MSFANLNSKKTPTNWSLPNSIVRRLGAKKRGRKWLSLCPFHLEKTPSFFIFEKTATYKCFGCGRSGTVRGLAKYLKIDVISNPVLAPIIQPVGDAKKSMSMSNILFWHRQLKNRRNYFHSRGFPDSVIDSELWGYAPDYQRYVVPIWDGEPGKSPVYCLKLRSLDKEPKYIGISGFNHPSLYNKYLLENSLERVFIVFGEFDAQSFLLMGEPAISPTAGVASFKDEWLELFGKVKKIFIVPDNTAQELEPACELREKFGSKARILFYPLESKDANEMLVRWGNLEKFWQVNSSALK